MKEPMSVEESRKTIVLDFDGVLHDYDEWQGPTTIQGGPVSGAVEFVWWLKEHGYSFYVLSVRAAHKGGKEAIREWLNHWGFPPNIDVSSTKTGGALYIDDRAFRFEGDFDEVMNWLAEHPNPGRWGLK